MHKGHRDRLRSRFNKFGIDGLEEHEILELLLFYAIPRKDVNPIAHTLIKRFGNLNNVLSADVDELTSVDGIGEQVAAFLSFISGVNKFINISSIGERPLINTPEIACKYITNLFKGKKNELFFVLMLDKQQRLIRAEKMGVGDHSSASANPRNVVQAAISSGAVYVILAHNHPGGSYIPSSADIALTESFEALLSSINIICAEHYIYTEKNCYAMKTKRKIPTNDRLAFSETDNLIDPAVIASSIKQLDVASLDELLSELDEELDDDTIF